MSYSYTATSEPVGTTQSPHRWRTPEQAQRMIELERQLNKALQERYNWFSPVAIDIVELDDQPGDEPVLSDATADAGYDAAVKWLDKRMMELLDE